MENAICSSRMSVRITDNYIQIVDDTGNEVAYWDRQEWVEDSEVTLSIAQAIVMALTQPHALRETLEFS